MARKKTRSKSYPKRIFDERTMTRPATFCLVLLLIMKVSLLCGQSIQDSLKEELSLAQTDTAKISILIDLAYSSETTQESLNYTEKAYLLGKEVSSIRHKSRSEIVHGYYLSEVYLDSGVAFMNAGIKRYESEEMWLHVANALYVKAEAFEFLHELDSAITFYEQSFYTASRNELHQEWGDAALALSAIYNLRGNNAEALKWASESKKAYGLKGDSETEIASVLNQMGIIYDQKRLYSEALDCYLKARESAITAEYIEGEILIDNNIGVIYDNMNNTEKAMKYFSEALEKAKIHNLVYDEATLLNNMSFMYQKKGDTTTAINLLQKALAIDFSNGYGCFKSYPLEAMGSLLLAKNELDSAEIYLNNALAIAEECEEVAIQSSIYKSLGQLYLKQKQTNESLGALQKSLKLAQNADLPTETQEALHAISQFYEITNQREKAYTSLKRYQLFSDSLFKANNIEKATRLASEFEFRKELVDLELQQLESERLLSEQIETMTSENRIILGGTFLLLFIAILFIRGYTLIRVKNKNLALLNEEKNKLIGVVAHDLRNPINMMKGLLPFLEESQAHSKDPEFAQYIDMLNRLIKCPI